jgi:hypothetical protein
MNSLCAFFSGAALNNLPETGRRQYENKIGKLSISMPNISRHGISGVAYRILCSARAAFCSAGASATTTPISAAPLCEA